MLAPNETEAAHKAETVVVARGVCVYYRDFTFCALDNVALEIRRGEIFGVVGPAGSGKSTMLRILAGRLRPTYGTIKVFGYSPPRAARKGRTGFVPDKTALQPGARGLARSVAGLFRRPPPASLAQVLARKPELILLDNPGAGLDPSVRETTRALILSLSREGRTVVFSSDSLMEVKGMCHRIAVINAGKIEALGTIEEVFASPRAVRVLAPLLPAPTLHRALEVIRQDMEVPPSSQSAPQKSQDTESRPRRGRATTALSANKILSSLVKNPPPAPPPTRHGK